MKTETTISIGTETVRDSAAVAALSAKKYAGLYPPLVERICVEERAKHKNERDYVKAVKTRLHILYGAYADEGLHKKATALAATPDGGSIYSLKHMSEDIMRLHASTRERLPFYDDLYAFIFNTVDMVESILDLGCGFNPFSIPWMPSGMLSGVSNCPDPLGQQEAALLKAYHACDIDIRTTKLLNCFFQRIGLPQHACNTDLVVETPQAEVDLAFMFKLIPVLEGQRKGRGFELLKLIRARYVVVTYPLKTLCGKEKGMGTHYAGQFEQASNEPCIDYKIIEKAEIGNELAYIIKKSPHEGRR